jgi:hypothetical protein
MVLIWLGGWLRA